MGVVKWGMTVSKSIFFLNNFFCLFAGVLVMGIASITFSLPHFLTGNHGISGPLSDSNNMSMGNICVRNNRLMTAAKPKASAGEELLMSLPGLEKIKSLTEGKKKALSRFESSSQIWFPYNN